MGDKVLPKRFDLDERRPSVLLFGNGIVRCFSKNSDWTRVIESLAVTSLDPEETGSFPYSIRATVTTDPDDVSRRKAYVEFFENEYQYHPNPLISELVDLPFDAFLTTNYTYELEYALKSNYPELKAKGSYAHVLDFIPESYQKKDAEQEDRWDDSVLVGDARGLRTFNRISGRDIWHIHGEIRRFQSFILTHDEYGRLMGAILKYNRMRGKNVGAVLDTLNEDGSPRKKELNFCSWFDYFLYGNLYIIGQGFDFSEFDLWWLMSRRQRARKRLGTGRAVFFQPLAPDGKLTSIEKALTALDVEIKDCGVRLSGDSEADQELYQEFYAKTVDQLKAMLPVPAPDDSLKSASG